jgi:peptide-methionine (R)-S-oxide reductase
LLARATNIVQQLSFNKLQKQTFVTLMGYYIVMHHLKIVFLYITAITTSSFTNCSTSQKNNQQNKTQKIAVMNNEDLKDSLPSFYSHTDTNKVVITNEEWRKILPPDVFNVAREKGTERPFTSPFEKNKETGTYCCVACGHPLFKSNAKFESGSGWPSFYEPIAKNSLNIYKDNSHGMVRVEVTCGRCDAHMGHVFDDAPQTPTGMRYCINGIVLKFKKEGDSTLNK